MRNSVVGAAVYPEGRLGAQDARSELRVEVGAEGMGGIPGPLLPPSLTCFPRRDLRLTDTPAFPAYTNSSPAPRLRLVAQSLLPA